MSTQSLQHYVALTIRRSTQCHPHMNYAPLRRWQSTNTSPFAARPPKPAELEIPPECYANQPSFPVPSFDKTVSKSDGTTSLETTRPAPLDSPEALDAKNYPSQSIPVSDRAKYLFRLGKSYLNFYKTGMKNIWSNYKSDRAIKQRISPFALSEVAKYGGQVRDGKALPRISRADYQLSLRTSHDLLKLVPFSLVFLICGEFTPLVIIALGSAVVPYTCRIPRQIQKDQEKATKRDDSYTDGIVQVEDPSSIPAWEREWREAYRYGLTIFRQPLPAIGPFYHKFFIHRSLVKHCDSVLCDTILIEQEGGFSKLSSLDLFEWADKYGLWALREYTKNNQKDGHVYIEDVKKHLLKAVEAEVKFTLDQDWKRLKPEEQWRAVFRSIGSKSPDWLNRMKAVEAKREKSKETSEEKSS